MSECSVLPGYFGLWLEAQGYRRTHRTLDFGARLYMRCLMYGLGLAVGLQVLHAGFVLVLH